MLLKLCVILLLSLLILITSTCQDEKMNLIGDAVEAFRPCSTGIITMERVIGGPPSKENYWDGIFNLKHLYPNLDKARFMLQLSSPVNISVNPEIGKVISSNNNDFNISYFKPSDNLKTLKFHVQGKPFGKFPNIIKILLNDNDVCPDPYAVMPTILGNQNFGVFDEK